MIALRPIWFASTVGSCLCAGAQFKVLPDSSASWVGHYESFDLVVNTSTFYYLSVNVDDTLINDTLFTKLWGYEFSNGTSSWPGGWNGGLYDNEEGQVYYYHPATARSYLLYDLDVMVGDSANVWVASASAHEALTKMMYIASVDTILIGGVQHKRIGIQSEAAILGGQGVVSWWIQGIGGTGGLLETPGNEVLDISGGLACMSSGDSLLWNWGPYGEPGSCIAMGIREAQAEDDAPWFRPTLVDDVIQIDATGTFSVLGADGREVYRGSAQGGALSMAHLRSGPYVLQLVRSGRPIKRGRFLKL